MATTPDAPQPSSSTVDCWLMRPDFIKMFSSEAIHSANKGEIFHNAFDVIIVKCWFEDKMLMRNLPAPVVPPCLFEVNKVGDCDMIRSLFWMVISTVDAFGSTIPRSCGDMGSEKRRKASEASQLYLKFVSWMLPWLTFIWVLDFIAQDGSDIIISQHVFSCQTIWLWCPFVTGRICCTEGENEPNKFQAQKDSWK